MSEMPDGWSRFQAEYRTGDVLHVPIARVVHDIGLFCDLPTGVHGIVHLSDLAWNKRGEELIGTFSVGDDVDVVVLKIEPKRQRVCLGIKQLRPKPPEGRRGSRGPEAGPVSSPGGGPRPSGYGGATKSLSDSIGD